MFKSIEEMYEELMAKSNLDNDNIIHGKKFDYDEDDESEDFFTSKEIVKQKEDIEERLGITPSQDDGIIEEDVHFKRYTKRREHKYTEKEMEEIKQSCEVSIVHDYGENDIFHMSDEERANNDMLAEMSLKLSRLKRTYRKIDQYIEAMRVVVEAWELLEKNNYVHDKDEFFKLVSEGKIVSNRIIMPKMKKLDRYNMDLVIKYISNPELDPKDLMPEDTNNSWDKYDNSKIEERYEQYINEYIENHKDEYDDETSYDLREKASEYAEEQIQTDEMERLLSPEEAQFILDKADNPPEIRVKDIPEKQIKGYDDRNITSFKKKKKLSKKERYIRSNLHDMLIKIQTNPTLNSSGDYYSSFMLTNSMFEQEEIQTNPLDKLQFRGSWADDDAVFLYDLAVREELLKQHPPKENYLTYSDKELANFFRILEENGINTVDLRRKMNCSDDALTKAKTKQTKKDNKKIESAILQRITKLNDNKKFKKIVNKAEKELQKYSEED